eukprot:symbB.v1.2.002659.t1/scaffold143.1/size299121/6
MLQCARSQGGGLESESNVSSCLCHASQIFVIHAGLPMDPIVTLPDINAVDRYHDLTIKTCALMGYSKRHSKVVTCFRRISAGLGNIFRP